MNLKEQVSEKKTNKPWSFSDLRGKVNRFKVATVTSAS